MIKYKGDYNTLHNVLQAYREAENKEEEAAAACLLEKIRIVV